MKKKTILKITITAGFLIVIVAALLLSLKNAYVLPILMYHSIDDNTRLSKLSVSPESFERQMKFLKDHRYNVISVEKAVSYIQNKERVPPKTIAITFDDGFYNNYKYAYPVLKKYGIPATIYVIVGKIGQPGYLGWKEIKEMSDSGLITIGSHTISHLWLPTMNTERLKSELNDSKKILEDKLGKPVKELCYPVGAHDERVKTCARQAGYACALATNPGRFAPNDDIYAIKRVRISRTSNNLFVFWIETSGYYTWIKEHRDE
ncbi:MAG: polysaccharide deacetylase family protein [Candidatus Omnitrophica bacterium]|nr:polysaccharide deacetylase family protein [Candidatus Omnitrophota bacterium]MCM8790936.1 polysaccharide deacetylase family protein [Candidatus Omnitrophota bacterium]